MEGVKSSSSITITGVTVVRSDAPSDYHVASRIIENPSQVVRSTPIVVPQVGGVAQPPATVAGVAGVAGILMKKKRGRPRKYAPDGSATGALSPKPISSSVPPPVRPEFSIEKPRQPRPPSSAIQLYQPRIETESLVPAGELTPCLIGGHFAPHILLVRTGEDVSKKLMLFSHQGPRAICILSATGVISSVTLRQPDSLGGTLTYEGRFEILSLTGSFMPVSGGTRARMGGLSVSLASPAGLVIGGGVAGMLVAGGPIQIVVGAFQPANQNQTKKEIPPAGGGMDDAAGQKNCSFKAHH